MSTTVSSTRNSGSAAETQRTPAKRKKPLRSRAYSTFRVVALVVVVVVFITPLLWMLLASFKTNVDIHDVSKSFIFTPVMENYIEVLGRGNYLQFVFNSLWIAFCATAVSLIIGVPAAYSMSRFAMRRSALLVLMARVIPGVSLLVPWYYVFANLGLVGGYGVLILSHMFILIPISLYIMISYFDSLSVDFEQAGEVDGLTPIGAFLRIVLPMSTPGIATAGILSFIFSWNNFMFALVLSSASTKTLPVAVFDFVSYASIDWGAIMAAAVIMTLPIIVVAMFAQKYIVSGLTAGATKG